jgi:hypothetical protein
MLAGMTAMRTITVTLPEHIVAAAEADVAAGVSPSIDAWIAGCFEEDVSSELVDELGRRLDSIDAGDEPMLSFDAFRRDINAQLGRVRPA